MDILNSDNYKYCKFNNNIIIFKNKNEISELSNDVIKIISNTYNTWQEDRDYDEKARDTLRGKIAESMFADFIEFSKINRKIKYLPYDTFRNDNNEKHAPIDGLLYEYDNKNIDNAIIKINTDIKNSIYGKLTNKTRKFLTNNMIYTVEIKSSRIPNKDYENIDLQRFNNSKEQEKLIKALRERDFFVYPEFTRKLGKTIHNFNQYCEYVKNIKPEFRNLSEDKLKSSIISYEIERKSDIHTRIFMDWNNTNSIIGYLTGYVLKSQFFDIPKIINMSRKGKSENALYYVYPINKSNYLENIFIDKRLWK